MPPRERPRWRTKTSNAGAVEHAGRTEADAAVEDLRRRFHAGAAALRVVRLYDPDGGVRVIDFAAEDRRAANALRDVERATAARERALAEVTERWEAAVARAVAAGCTPQEVAAAAGTTVSAVRKIVRRRV